MTSSVADRVREWSPVESARAAAGFPRRRGPVGCDFAAAHPRRKPSSAHLTPRGWRGVRDVSGRPSVLPRGWRGVGRPPPERHASKTSMKPGTIPRAGDGNRTRMTSLEGPRASKTVDCGGRRKTLTRRFPKRWTRADVGRRHAPRDARGIALHLSGAPARSPHRWRFARVVSQNGTSATRSRASVAH